MSVRGYMCVVVRVSRELLQLRRVAEWVVQLIVTVKILLKYLSVVTWERVLFQACLTETIAEWVVQLIVTVKLEILSWQRTSIVPGLPYSIAEWVVQLIVTVKLEILSWQRTSIVPGLPSSMHVSLALSGRPRLSMCLAGVVVPEGRPTSRTCRYLREEVVRRTPHHHARD